MYLEYILRLRICLAQAYYLQILCFNMRLGVIRLIKNKMFCKQSLYLQSLNLSSTYCTKIYYFDAIFCQNIFQFLRNFFNIFMGHFYVQYLAPFQIGF